ncbi:HMA2 domain-containing protein [Sutterella sp.]|uniref:HMA2 domain-containing protein n=1 Tax=Sutterella sp. TaxID=1981025 RepID=UPI0026E0C96A|nr:hypothetical protein [Sutterella sp.]MDO5532719.1 hypothetical protein [Sutterella sp.]
MLDPRTFVRSVTRGRARIRHAALAGLSAEEVKQLTDMLLAYEGITSVSINPRVGSLLVTWDETKTNAEALLEAAAFFLPEEEPAAEEPAAGCTCCGEVKKVADGAVRAAKGASNRVLDLLAPVVAPDQQKGGRVRRVTQNRIMLAAFGVSIATLAVRGVAAHLAFGAAFMALLGIHLYQHRRVI